MIIVIEGASAAGKTTWCRRFAAERALLEGEPPAPPEPTGASLPDPPDLINAAKYWAETNSRRYAAARSMSKTHGWVACDTDPFKLHFAWTLWTVGLASRDYWHACRTTCRAAFATNKLGLADLIFFADVDEATLRRQKAGDTTRSRNRHEMHVQIAPSLKRWYQAVAALDPARVHFSLPSDGLEPNHFQIGPRAQRSGAALFDSLMAELEVQA